ncbi:hypothetical protein, partial [Vreelandella venusta]|uniref:hypothetical protein n=1 Tax=Vreelandella venusta TaxID=44935 RepID=UPI0022858ABA
GRHGSTWLRFPLNTSSLLTTQAMLAGGQWFAGARVAEVGGAFAVVALGAFRAVINTTQHG